MEPQGWFSGVFDEDYLAIYDHANDPARAEREAWEIVRALNLAAGGRVLDCPCGTGRHSLVLAKAGFQVTGADLCRTFLDRARSEAARLRVDLELIEADMRELPQTFSGRFDAAFNAFTSFGYFDSDQDNARVLAELARAVRPGGRVLVELANHLHILRDMRPKTWFRGKNCLVLEELSYDWAKDQFVNRREVRFDDGRRREMPAFRIRAYKPAEVLQLADSAGLRRIEVAGGYDGSPFEALESPRMVLLFEK